MSVLSRFQFNTLLRAALVAFSPTINSFVGTNTTNQVDYFPAYYLTNAALCGLHPKDLGGTALPASSIGASGWPTVAFQLTVTATIGPSDGQLPHGTYQSSYRLLAAQPGWTAGAAGSTTVSANSGCMVSNLQLQTDNITVNFTMVTQALQNVILAFSGGATFVGIPRDGVSDMYTAPEFPPECVNFMKQFPSFRMMDFNNTIPGSTAATNVRAGMVCIIYGGGSTDFTTIGASNNNLGTLFTATGTGAGSSTVLVVESTWANRTTDYGSTSPGFPFSLERQIRFMNAVANAPGSKITHIWFNISAFADDSYSSGCAGLFNSLYTGNVPLEIEVGNEPWNSGSSIYPTYSQMAQAECQTLATYGVALSNPLNPGGSVIGDGTTTTVTLKTGFAMPSYVTAGAQFLVQDGTSTFAKNSAGTAYSLTNLATVISVTSTTFTYASQGNGTMPLTDSYRCYFNSASTLLQDGISTDIYQLIFKWYVRQVYRVWTKFNAAGRTDRFVLNLQPYSQNGVGAGRGLPIHFRYANWLANYTVPGQTINSFIYGAAIANYVTARCRFSSANTASPNQIQGCAIAPYVQPGDTMKVSGVGATTVGTGSSGTTLVITGAVSANETYSAPNTILHITYTGGDSSAICNAMLYGNMPEMEVGIRAHAYACTLYGLRMMCYELSMDMQGIPNQNVAVASNPLSGKVLTTLLDLWLSCGGKEVFAFTAQPGVITNGAEGGWNYMTSWTDTTSPRIAALLAYVNQPAYGNIYTPSPGAAPALYAYAPSGVGNVLTDLSAMAGVDSAGASFSINTTNGMAYWSNNTGVRTLFWNGVFPQSRVYSATLGGSDSVAGTVATIWVDSAQVGYATLLQNGGGNSNATAPGAVTVYAMDGTTGIAITGGQHNVSVQFTGSAPNIGVQPGIASLIFV